MTHTKTAHYSIYCKTRSFRVPLFLREFCDIATCRQFCKNNSSREYWKSRDITSFSKQKCKNCGRQSNLIDQTTKIKGSQNHGFLQYCSATIF